MFAGIRETTRMLTMRASAAWDVTPSVVGCAVAGYLVAAASVVGCTDAQLYDPVEVPSQPDKVAFTGTVCTDNPAERSFPLRVVFLVDDSAEQPAGLDAAATAALQLRRVDAIRDVVSTLRAPDTKFALVRYGGEALVAPDGGFTDSASAIVEAAGALTVPMPCTDDGCRRSGQALSLANSLVGGDLLSTPRGPRSRTKYVLVFVQHGPVDDEVLSGATTPDCDEACLLETRVRDLRQSVLDGGGADLQVHALDVASLSIDADVRATTQDELQRMTFAGSGEYRPVCARDGNGNLLVPSCGAQSLSLLSIEINSARNVFLSRSFVVANLNARTHIDGSSVPDSDADGLSDDEEASLGTTPTLRDSDGDGISDKVEILLQTTGLQPLVFDDPPTCLSIPLDQRATRDTDGDGLVDCEEALLRLDTTLFDSDRDGIPDLLEVLAGTNFLEDDGLDDADFDGSPNLEEVRGHSDPRSADAPTRTSSSYLYREVDLGIRDLLFASQPREISGVTVEDISAQSSTGNGVLSFIRAVDAIGVRTLLVWRDANETTPGPAVDVAQDGVYTLRAACIGLDACERAITVRVTSALLPPFSVDEFLRVASADRQCTDFRVRNVTLVETLATATTPAGANDVRIFFGQVPATVERAFGIFRVAQFPFVFTTSPTPHKEPDVDDQFVDDFRFVLFE